ncbi:MAG: PilZ domain-containing protein [Desulfobulbaceae bacterium]|nr:PilZ domain-containing protein [Desulfobulbaceae bacterium]HIJ79949.1 PilZ domain-containing protein [Deltaproteobacteria bacterium]
MKKIWTADTQLIFDELSGLVSTAARLILYQKGSPPNSTTASQIHSIENKKLLELTKEKPFQAPQGSALFLYQPPGNAMRGFYIKLHDDSADKLVTEIPGEIIQFQRRRHPRIATANNCKATFTRKGSQYLNNGIIENISREGAKLTGNFSQHIKQGDILSPLSMSLRLRFGDYEENVTAGEAVVKRLTKNKKGETELGVQFCLQGTDHEYLDRYLSIRSLENYPHATK